MKLHSPNLCAWNSLKPDSHKLGEMKLHSYKLGECTSLEPDSYNLWDWNLIPKNFPKIGGMDQFGIWFPQYVEIYTQSHKSGEWTSLEADYLKLVEMKPHSNKLGEWTSLEAISHNLWKI